MKSVGTGNHRAFAISAGACSSNQAIVQCGMGTSMNRFGMTRMRSLGTRRTERSEEDLISSAPLAVITRGAEGSVIYENGQEILQIPVAPISGVVDPTGAGDAYLAGLAVGIARDLPLEITGRVAALAAAYAVEHSGPQEHYYTPDEFAERYTSAFGSSPEIEALAEPARR